MFIGVLGIVQLSDPSVLLVLQRGDAPIFIKCSAERKTNKPKTNWCESDLELNNLMIKQPSRGRKKKDKL